MLLNSRGVSSIEWSRSVRSFITVRVFAAGDSVLLSERDDFTGMDALLVLLVEDSSDMAPFGLIDFSLAFEFERLTVLFFDDIELVDFVSLTTSLSFCVEDAFDGDFCTF